MKNILIFPTLEQHYENHSADTCESNQKQCRQILLSIEFPHNHNLKNK